MLKKLLKSRKGFTIIEMLAVVAIIGILSTVLYVSYEKYITTSREQMCKAQVLQICDAFELRMVKNAENETRADTDEVTLNNFTTYSEMYDVVTNTFDEEYSEFYKEVTGQELLDGAELSQSNGSLVYTYKGLTLTYDPVKKVFA